MFMIVKMAKKNYLFIILAILIIGIILGAGIYYFVSKDKEVTPSKNLIITKDYTIDFYDSKFYPSNQWEKPSWNGDRLETISLYIKPLNGDIIANYSYLIIYDDSKTRVLRTKLYGIDTSEISVYDEKSLIDYEHSLNNVNNFAVFKIVNPGQYRDYPIVIEKTPGSEAYAGNIVFEVYTSNDGKFNKANKIKELLLNY